MNKRRKIIRAMASAAGGGVKRPASPSDIIQWLTAYDGVTPFVDRKDIVTSPEVTGVNCLSFDGTNDYSSVQGITGITGYPFRLRARVKFSNTGPVLAAVSLTDSTVTTSQFYIGQNSGRLALLARNGIPRYVETGGTYNDNEWHCVEGRFVSETERELFVGDDWDSLVSVAGGTGETAVPFFTPNSLSLGTNYDSSPGQFWDGELSDASVYSDAGVTLVAKYPLQEGSGTVAHDVSGNGNHGTITGATWTTADDIPSYNLENGFRVAVQGTPPYIPSEKSTVPPIGMSIGPSSIAAI